jgi:hypothetical protein
MGGCYVHPKVQTTIHTHTHTHKEINAKEEEAVRNTAPMYKYLHMNVKILALKS